MRKRCCGVCLGFFFFFFPCVLLFPHPPPPSWWHIPPHLFRAEWNALRSIKCLVNVRCSFPAGFKQDIFFLLRSHATSVFLFFSYAKCANHEPCTLSTLLHRSCGPPIQSHQSSNPLCRRRHHVNTCFSSLNLYLEEAPPHTVLKVPHEAVT